MKKALLKDSFKEITKTYKRFFSILLMAFMGVGFFAGVRATSPDMKMTIDKFLDKNNVYDINIVSTLGLTDDDITAINEVDGVEKAYGLYSEDVFLDFEDEEAVVKVHELPKDINNVELIEGELPKNLEECVIEHTMKTSKNISVGDYIEIKENLEEDEEPSFQSTKLKVVGTVKSPLYISRDKGTTTLGSGKISYYIYVPKENIVSEIYTEIDVIANGSKELSFISYEYDDLISRVKNNIKSIKEERQESRHTELIDEATQKLNDAQKEFDEQKGDAEIKIKDAEKELEDGKKDLAKAESKIRDGERELAEGKEKANTEFANAESQISEGDVKISNSQNELNQAKNIFESKKKEATDGISKLESGIKTVTNTITELESTKSLLESTISLYTNLESLNRKLDNLKEQLANATTEEEKDTITAMINQIEPQINALNQEKDKLVAEGLLDKATIEENLSQTNEGINACKEQKVVLENQLTQVKNELLAGEKQITDAQNQINAGIAELESSKNKLNTSKAETAQKFADAEKEIADGKREIEKAKKELSNGEKELTEKKEEFNIKIADAEKKLIDAREKINDIENAKWYIFDRADNTGFNSYSQDTDNIEKLGKLFPIVFFIIATLISLTTMTRMVEEERVQIGTLKALGYSKFQIMSKYIIYSLLASLIGGILGAIFGLKFFPYVIITMYQMMYDITDLVIEFNRSYTILGIGIMTICMLVATILTANGELSCTPAELMRPKSPKPGKRVLLEKIPFIWNRLNFTQKVTVRNMFRYKKKFLMTVIGICGCTALIVTGFGLKDSISGIMDYQYVDIYNYDLLVALKNTLTQDEKQSLKNSLLNRNEIKDAIELYMTSESIKNNDMQEDVQIIATSNLEDLDKVIKLKDLKTGDKLELNNEGIIITDKLAQLLNAKVGDEINLLDSDKNEYKVKIIGITEHYISHYVYITENLYEKLFNEEISSNVFLVQYTEKLEEAKEQEITTAILGDSKVASVVKTSYLMETMNDTLSAMNFVVYVLIASAGMLAFIVLFTLSNINISERIRELATIKVLGFYDNEVYDYVTREIIFLTIIGILVGLVFGYILNMFILGTCEIGILRFKKEILSQSYLFASLITVIFTAVINFITYFSLKKIDMIESLKSVE